MLVEPLLHFPDNLCVGGLLSSVFKSQVAIQNMNISLSPIKIYKGMKLGTATPEQNIFLVSHEEVQTTPQLPSF